MKTAVKPSDVGQGHVFWKLGATYAYYVTDKISDSAETYIEFILIDAVGFEIGLVRKQMETVLLRPLSSILEWADVHVPRKAGVDVVYGRGGYPHAR